MRLAARVRVAILIVSAVVAATVNAPSLAAQTGDPQASSRRSVDDDGWKVWGSLGLFSGQVRAPEFSLAPQTNGGHLSLWVTHDRFAICARAVGFPLTTDGGIGVGDQAILAGIHVPKGHRVDLVVALGAGKSGATGYLVEPKSESMFEAGAQLNADYRLVGIGVDVLAGAGRTRRYVATGISLSLGWFH